MSGKLKKGDFCHKFKIILKYVRINSSHAMSRVASFFFTQFTKTGENIPNDQKYQIATKYTEGP